MLEVTDAMNICEFASASMKIVHPPTADSPAPHSAVGCTPMPLPASKTAVTLYTSIAQWVLWGIVLQVRMMLGLQLSLLAWQVSSLSPVRHRMRPHLAAPSIIMLLSWLAP